MPDSQHSYRRTYDGRRRRRSHWRKDVSLFVLFIVACAVLAIVQLAERLWPLAVLVAAGYAGWRWRRRRALPPSGNDQKVIRGQVVDEDAEREAQLRAELSRVRRQVADLEDAAGRPIDAIIQTYKHLQRQYGPAAVGKTERRP